MDLGRLEKGILALTFIIPAFILIGYKAYNHFKEYEIKFERNSLLIYNNNALHITNRGIDFIEYKDIDFAALNTSWGKMLDRNSENEETLDNLTRDNLKIR